MTRSASAEALPRRLVLATTNRGKVKDLRHLLGDDWVIQGMEEFNAEAAEETGSTFEQNAILKAEAVALQTGLPSLADDSGLVVDALGGAPGVYSARYAGPASTDAANRSLLLAHMTRVETGSRSCRFMCVIALAVPGRSTAKVRGTCEGTIGFRECGTNGFGYDSLFVLPDGRTMAELEGDERNAISHRGQAMRILLPMLKDAFSSGNETC